MATPWTPESLSGLALWMDASDSSTIVASGGSISQWNDKSGRNNNFTQTNSSNRPTYVANQYNGLNCVRFAANQYFSFPRPFTSLGSTFIVYNTSDTRYLHFSNGSGAPHSIALEENSSDSGLSNSLGGNNGYFYNGNPANWATRGQAWADLNTGQVRVLEHTQMSLASMPSTIGWNIDGSWSMVGDICEIVFTEGYISTEDRQILEGYLAHKWGFASFLPSNHPFKSNSPVIASIYGIIKDKNNQPAIRKIYVIDETTDVLLTVSNSQSDGSFNILVKGTSPKTLVVTGEPDRNALVFSGIIPD